MRIRRQLSAVSPSFIMCAAQTCLRTAFLCLTTVPARTQVINGFAPRRTLLLALGTSFVLSSRLTHKYGDNVAAISKQLSDATRTQAEQVGFLPASANKES